MDKREIKERIIKLRFLLKENNISGDLFILFGSQASGKARKDSDIDIAVISRNFGVDRFKEGSKLNLLASSIDSRIEAVPIGLREYLSKESVSPILHQIIKTGIAIL